tara:strand:- start:2492 stop:3805 length:1314 start_codon:yes stop_codon:yes gene_type:complete
MKAGRIFLIFISIIALNSCSFEQGKKGDSVENFLSSILKTHRISSNHYSEIVTDSLGHSYIASFAKKSDNRDYVQIIKLDHDGVVLWIKGGRYKGRSTAISLSNNGNILVTGWADSILDFDGFRIEEEDNAKVFVAELDHNGRCLNMMTFKSDGVFNIRSNNKGLILVSGACNSDNRFGKFELNDESKKCKYFIGMLDDELNFIWVKSVDYQIVRIKNYQDDFYISGKFNTKMTADTLSLYTSSDMDEDGYVFKMNYKGKVAWAHQFGLKNAPLEYATSKESGGDIAFAKNGDVLVSAVINSEFRIDQNTLNVFRFGKHGNRVEKFELEGGMTTSISTLNVDVNDNIWITGNKALNEIPSIQGNQNNYSFISQYSSDFDKIRDIEISHGKNMIFRSSYYKDSTLRYTGHFQGQLKIDKDSLTNDGEHEMFLYQRKVD